MQFFATKYGKFADDHLTWFLGSGHKFGLDLLSKYSSHNRWTVIATFQICSDPNLKLKSLFSQATHLIIFPGLTQRASLRYLGQQLFGNPSFLQSASEQAGVKDKRNPIIVNLSPDFQLPEDLRVYSNIGKQASPFGGGGSRPFDPLFLVLPRPSDNRPRRGGLGFPFLSFQSLPFRPLPSPECPSPGPSPPLPLPFLSVSLALFPFNLRSSLILAEAEESSVRFFLPSASTD